jgi:hypothetical protein
MRFAQTTTEYPQVPEHPPTIVAAANERAAMWQYPADSRWTVSVQTPKGVREVTHKGSGAYDLGRPIK